MRDMLIRNSSFDLERQNREVESRIVVALERISEAFRVLLWKESKVNTLSSIQIQILIFLRFHSREKSRISYLAKEFNMTKATVSESVKGLLMKSLVKKQPDVSDTRSYTLSLTEAGEQTASNVSAFSSFIEQPISQLDPAQKDAMLGGLLKLIHDLNRMGIITVQRMCYTCAYYRSDNGSHYCRLLQAALFDRDIRLDCPEHQAVTDPPPPAQILR